MLLAIDERTLLLSTDLVLDQTSAMFLVADPVAFVAITGFVVVNTEALHLAVDPSTLLVSAIGPRVATLAVELALLELTNVELLLMLDHSALPVKFTILEPTFIKDLLLDHELLSKTFNHVGLSLSHLTNVDEVFSFNSFSALSGVALGPVGSLTIVMLTQVVASEFNLGAFFLNDVVELLDIPLFGEDGFTLVDISKAFVSIT